MITTAGITLQNAAFIAIQVKYLLIETPTKSQQDLKLSRRRLRTNRRLVVNSPFRSKLPTHLMGSK